MTLEKFVTQGIAMTCQTIVFCRPAKALEFRREAILRVSKAG